MMTASAKPCSAACSDSPTAELFPGSGDFIKGEDDEEATATLRDDHDCII